MQDPKKDRFLVALGLFLTGLGMALANMYPQWAPDYAYMMFTIAVLASLFMLGAIVWMAMGLRARFAGPSPRKGANATLGATVLLGAFWVPMVMVQVFMLSGGLFAPVFYDMRHFPEHGVTLYRYDTSFLDPSTRLLARRDPSFFMEPVADAGIDPVSFTLELDGDYVTFPGGRYHLPTGATETSPMNEHVPVD